jgi:hypothetical protein
LEKTGDSAFDPPNPLKKEASKFKVPLFKGRKRQKEKLKHVRNWQERLRNFIDTLAEEKPS